MKRFLLGLMTLIALTGAAPVAVIEGKTDVIEGGTIILDARKSVSDTPLAWNQLDDHWQKISPEKERPVLMFDKGGRSDVFIMIPSAEQGVYRFCLTVKGTPPADPAAPAGTPPPGLDAEFSIIEVIVSPRDPLPPTPIPNPPGPTPTPTPIPNPPTPPAPPTPLSGPLFASLIYDASALNAATTTAEIRSTPTIVADVQAAGFAWHAYTTTNPEVMARSTDNPSGLNLGSIVTVQPGMATVLVQDAKGGKVTTFPCPATSAGLLDALKAIKNEGTP